MLDDMTAEEKQEFGEVFAEIDSARDGLERAAKQLEGRGYDARAHKLRGVAQSADAQKYLLVQDWRAGAVEGNRAA